MDINTLYEFTLDAHAGLALDHQQDSGIVFEKIAQWWPAGWTPPDLGRRRDTGTYAALVKVGSVELPTWPIDTPEEALASSMYFILQAPTLMAGRNLEALEKVANILTEARHIHQLEIPAGFGAFCKEAALSQAERAEVMVDAGLPVTTRVQTEMSCRMFADNDDRWPAGERIVVSTKLHKAASQHGLDWTHSLVVDPSSVTIPKSAGVYLAKRAELLNGSNLQGAHHQHQLTMMAHQCESGSMPMADLVKMANDLEQLDLRSGLVELYGDHIPDAASTLVTPFETDPFGAMREAILSSQNSGPDWSKLDLDKLAAANLVPAALMGYLETDREQTLAQMPDDIKAVLADYIKE